MPRKVVASLYVTLDGYIDEPGQWSFPFWSEEASQFKALSIVLASTQLITHGYYSAECSCDGVRQAPAVWKNAWTRTGPFHMARVRIPLQVNVASYSLIWMEVEILYRANGSLV